MITIDFKQNQGQQGVTMEIPELKRLLDKQIAYKRTPTYSRKKHFLKHT